MWGAHAHTEPVGVSEDLLERMDAVYSVNSAVSTVTISLNRTVPRIVGTAVTHNASRILRSYFLGLQHPASSVGRSALSFGGITSSPVTLTIFG